MQDGEYGRARHPGTNGEVSGEILFLKRLAWPCELDMILPQNLVWQDDVRGWGVGLFLNLLILSVKYYPRNADIKI